jgi:hypothetical protein
MISQKIKTLMYPILGLELEPPTPEGELRIEGDVQPVMALVVAKTPNGSVLIEGTVDGALKTADTGSGLDSIEVSAGNATDTLTDLALAAPYTKLIITVTVNPLQITFETATSTYSSTVDLAVGIHERELSGVDLQVANVNAGQTASYQVEAYS